MKTTLLPAGMLTLALLAVCLAAREDNNAPGADVVAAPREEWASDPFHLTQRVRGTRPP